MKVTTETRIETIVSDQLEALPDHIYNRLYEPLNKILKEFYELIKEENEG